MKSVFVDSSGFTALIAQDDQFHSIADELFRQADAERWKLVTSNAIVWECYTVLLTHTRPGRQNATTFLDMMAGDAYKIDRISKRDEDKAIRILREHEDKEYSFCDALSFVVMERLRIREAIAFDRHFRSYGRFLILGPAPDR